MRRTPLRRRTGLARRTSLRVRTRIRPLHCDCRPDAELCRHCRKRAERSDLRDRLLAGSPTCEREGCSNLATDLHERLRRSQGGSTTDPANVVLLCRDCHRWVTENPQAAHAEGLVAWSWETRTDKPARGMA